MATSSSLNVIALISGGKDSFFSILHCQTHGHTIVALANLYPVLQESGDGEQDDDVDSYMYQTVGHAVMPLYEQALDIPLYRQGITGSAVNASRDYTPQEQDETEDLVPLLQRITKEHPHVNAVSTGAILSTYQRTRVESVALRLGLTPLSYLWQYPLLPPYTQSALLHDMAAVGQEAVIIKTASGGLDETFLGLDVAKPSTVAKLSRTMARFGEAGNGAIVGEGGEFETLALNGPGGLWKRKIRLGEVESKGLGGGQTVLRIRECGVVEKKDGDVEREGVLRMPELFDQEFKRILDTSSAAPQSTPSCLLDTPTPFPGLLSTNTHTNTPTLFVASNLASHIPSASPSRQLTRILLRLSHILALFNLPASRITHCTLTLRSMSSFAVLNPIYASFFSAVNPPARVTIAAGDAMPASLAVMLSVVLDKTDREDDRQGLHVQGRSYWAPANIGPYSQAISVPLPRRSDTDGEGGAEIVYVAGQIPLAPASMEVYTPHGFCGQVVLSLQHLWRIGRAKNVRWWTAGVAFVPSNMADVETGVCVAQDAWRAIHGPPVTGGDDEDEDGEDVDPWDRINSGAGNAFNDTTYRAPIPDRAAISSTETVPMPPCYVVQIESLPRDVNVEWSATGLTSTSIHVEGTTASPGGSRSVFRAEEISKQSDIKMDEWTSATVYTGRGFAWDTKWNMAGVQSIPCMRVWGNSGEEVRGVIVGRLDGSEVVG
jgi:diphthine-ammonia ligase